MSTQHTWWNLELENKPDYDMAMQRIYAWYAGEVIDRPPVRFMAHNADFNRVKPSDLTAEQLKLQWFDVEYQLDSFIASIAGKTFRGETFPIYWPNLGPDVYAAFFGAQLEYGEITSWSHPLVQNWEQMDKLEFSTQNEYFCKIEELTRHALERCPGKFMVGYTDFHPGADCAMAWRGPTNLCMDLYDNPAKVKALIQLASRDFQPIYDHFDNLLKEAGQLSCTWIGVPSFGKMHVPSCDWSAMISPTFFEEFSLPVIQTEVQPMDHNIFHLDGKGVARNLDALLQIDKIQAIQWVQGMGDDQPIMQWIPLIQKVQSSGKAIIVDLQLHELEPFLDAVRPEGIYLWIGTQNEEEELSVLKRLFKWT